MTIQTFIEKASSGGFHAKHGCEHGIEHILLDPEAWKAVGKVERWEPGEPYNGSNYEDSYTGEWLTYMHEMIDALVEGKTIEQYLETL